MLELNFQPNPFYVMLIVPIGVLGKLLGASLGGMNNDVYFLVAFSALRATGRLLAIITHSLTAN